MTAPIRTTGADHWTPRPPVTDAMRQHKHGRILPMERPEGQPGIIAGTIATLLGLAFIAAVFAAIQFAAASPASSQHPVCEEGRGQGCER